MGLVQQTMERRWVGLQRSSTAVGGLRNERVSPRVRKDQMIFHLDKFYANLLDRKPDSSLKKS
jgi:hypothetical protein